MGRALALLMLVLPAVAMSQATDGGGAAVRIVQPQEAQRLAQTYVAVQYELLNPNAAGTPTFRLRLDDREPIETAFTEHTFTGLKPGTHTLIVELIDANGTPVSGGRVEVRFVSTEPPPRTQEGEGPPSTKPRFSGEGKVVYAVVRR